MSKDSEFYLYIDVEAKEHEQVLRENGCEEWDYDKEESNAIGQGKHSCKYGAEIAADLILKWAKDWCDETMGTDTMNRQGAIGCGKDLLEYLELKIKG